MSGSRRRAKAHKMTSKLSWREWARPSSWWSYLTGTSAQESEQQSTESVNASPSPSTISLNLKLGSEHSVARESMSETQHYGSALLPSFQRRENNCGTFQQVGKPVANSRPSVSQATVLPDAQLEGEADLDEGELSWIAEASDDEKAMEEGQEELENREAQCTPTVPPQAPSLKGAQATLGCAAPNVVGVGGVPWPSRSSVPVPSLVQKTSGSANDFNAQLCSTQPLTTSTPQASPESHRHDGTLTDLQPRKRAFPSLHHSPFYSGRTSFGGSGLTLKRARVQRAHVESSPSPLTVSNSVCARPALPTSSSHPVTPYPHAVASQTTKIILAKLRNLSSPVADARRIPMRLGPREHSLHQPVKRRRKEQSPHTTPYSFSVFDTTNTAITASSQTRGSAFTLPKVVSGEQPSLKISSGLAGGKRQRSPVSTDHDELRPKDSAMIGKNSRLGDSATEASNPSYGLSSHPNLKPSYRPTTSAFPSLPVVDRKTGGISSTSAAVGTLAYTLQPPDATGQLVTEGAVNNLVSVKSSSAHSLFTFTTPKRLKVQQNEREHKQDTFVAFNFSAPKSFSAKPLAATEPSTFSAFDCPSSDNYPSHKVTGHSAAIPPNNPSVVNLPQFERLHDQKGASRGKGKEVEVMDLTEDDEEEQHQGLGPPSQHSLKQLSGFAPPAGSWSCDTCLLSNKPSDDKCIACGEANPNCAPPTTHVPTADVVHSGSVSVCTSGGFKLSGSLPCFTSTPVRGIPLLSSMNVPNGERLKNEQRNQSSIPMFGGTGGFKLGNNHGLAKTGDQAVTLGSSGRLGECSSLTSTTNQGFKFGTTGGLKLGGTIGLQLGKTCTGLKKEQAGEVDMLAKFAPPPGAWSCDVCMITNEADVEQCAACSSPRPVGGQAVVEQSMSDGPKVSGLGLSVKSGNVSMAFQAQPSGEMKLGGMPLLKPILGSILPPQPQSGFPITLAGGLQPFKVMGVKTSQHS